MKKKVVFISLPMSGLSDECVKANIEAAKTAYLTITKLDITQVAFVHNLGCTVIGHSEMDQNHLAIFYLSEALKRLAECDEAFFWFGWMKARGCQVEHDVCIQYGIPLIAVDNVENYLSSKEDLHGTV